MTNKRLSRCRSIALLFPVLTLLAACSDSRQSNDVSKPLSQNRNAAVDSALTVWEGFHDISNCDGIVGWAWDKNRPDVPVKVEIYDGKTLIASVTADLFRQDLLDAHKGNGKHGFNYPVPPQLKDGRPHAILIKYELTGLDLGNTPKELNCRFQ